MFIQQIDDIKRHGPPTSYDEDSFEKNHGRIRDKIFLCRTRKQEAETQQKDTLNIFSALILVLVDSSKTVKFGTVYILVITYSAAIFIIILVC